MLLLSLQAMMWLMLHVTFNSRICKKNENQEKIYKSIFLYWVMELYKHHGIQLFHLTH